MLDRCHSPGFAVLSLMFAAALGAGLGCGSDTEQSDPDDAWTLEDDTGTEPDTDPDAEPEPDTGVDPDGGCGGRVSLACVESCGDDFSRQPVCENGEWVCPSRTKPAHTCPDGTCRGATPPATCVSSCVDDSEEGKECDNDGFWSCPEGTFDSNRYCGAACGVDISNSNLDGVTIRFPAGCHWAVEAVREGVEIPYEVVVEEQVDGVIPHRNNVGNCDSPGESGLITSAEFTGNDQRWCRCDAGNCPPLIQTAVTLEPGTYRNTIEWEGRNWTGPSDTGNPKGEPFPPGTYELSVLATGERVYPDAKSPFELEATTEIELIE